MFAVVGKIRDLKAETEKVAYFVGGKLGSLGEGWVGTEFGLDSANRKVKANSAYRTSPQRRENTEQFS